MINLDESGWPTAEGWIKANKNNNCIEWKLIYLPSIHRWLNNLQVFQLQRLLAEVELDLHKLILLPLFNRRKRKKMIISKMEGIGSKRKISCLFLVFALQLLHYMIKFRCWTHLVEFSCNGHQLYWVLHELHDLFLINKCNVGLRVWHLHLLINQFFRSLALI